MTASGSRAGPEQEPSPAPGAGPIDYEEPVRLGRDSVTFRVIGERPQTGLLAGVPALVLQVLHPSIGTGVHEHSQVKEAPIQRLRRTADYVGATAFGDDETALRLIERVNRRHRPVRGTNPVTGDPFTADDAELQAYVHTTEMWAFLAAHRFVAGNRAVSEADEDRYWLELRAIGALLGCPLELVPSSGAEARSLLDRMRPQLAATREALDVIGFLLAPGGSPLFTALAPARPLNRRAAAALLPDDVCRLAGLPVSRRADRAVRSAVRAGDRLTGPVTGHLALRLAGPDALALNRAIPARTVQRGFTLAEAHRAGR